MPLNTSMSKSKLCSLNINLRNYNWSRRGLNITEKEKDTITTRTLLLSLFGERIRVSLFI